jgi:hypothetical protein
MAAHQTKKCYLPPRITLEIAGDRFFIVSLMSIDRYTVTTGAANQYKAYGPPGNIF